MSAAVGNSSNFLGKKVEFENDHHGIMSPNNFIIDNDRHLYFRKIGWVARVKKEQGQEDAFKCCTWRKETFELSQSETQSAIKRYQDTMDLIPKSELNQLAAIEFSDNDNSAEIKQCEMDWMIQQRPLQFDRKQICLDLGQEEAKELFNEITKFEEKYKGRFVEDIFGALAWNGVVTRWRQFMSFLDARFTMNHIDAVVDAENQPEIESKDENDNDSVSLIKDARDALLQFGASLGRVISYRALALTQSEYESIITLNEILPTGRLRASWKEMRDIVDSQGATKIAVARLYISQLTQWIGLDPSLSLHDDCETALCISQTYMDPKAGKFVYLFEMNVPKIMAMGFKIVDVQNRSGLVDAQFADKQNRKRGKQSDRWFEHNGVWFDAYDERTERQLLYSIPFLKERCRTITVFKSREDLKKRIEPFGQQQQLLKSAADKE